MKIDVTIDDRVLEAYMRSMYTHCGKVSKDMTKEVQALRGEVDGLKSALRKRTIKPAVYLAEMLKLRDGLLASPTWQRFLRTFERSKCRTHTKCVLMDGFEAMVDRNLSSAVAGFVLSHYKEWNEHPASGLAREAPRPGSPAPPARRTEALDHTASRIEPSPAIVGTQGAASAARRVR